MKYIPLLVCLLLAGKLSAQYTSEQWVADLAQLAQQLPSRHPAFPDRYSPQEFVGNLQALAGKLAGRSDLEIGLEVQAILARLGDAHTRIDLTTLLQKQNPIPLGLGWYADGVFVSGTVHRFQGALGKKVLRINGLPMAEALERVGRFTARETTQSYYKDALPWLRFPTACRMAGVATTDTLELLLEDPNGQTQTLRVFPLDMQNRADMAPAQFKPKSPDLRWQPAQNLFTQQWLPADSVLYVQYNRCRSREMSLEAGDSVSASRLPAFAPFADSVVAFLERTPGAKLFLDLRFNPGGGARDGIALARRLATLPTVNRPDRLFVATNLYTFSSAVQVAAVFGEKTNATLIGEAPSQPPNHFGEVRSFTLPQTGLSVTNSTKFMQVVTGNPALLQPDVVVPLRFADFREGKDPVLDYVRRGGK